MTILYLPVAQIVRHALISAHLRDDWTTDDLSLNNFNTLYPLQGDNGSPGQPGVSGIDGYPVSRHRIQIIYLCYVKTLSCRVLTKLTDVSLLTPTFVVF